MLKIKIDESNILNNFISQMKEELDVMSSNMGRNIELGKHKMYAGFHTKLPEYSVRGEAVF